MSWLKLKSLVRSPDVAWATVLVTASVFLTAFTVYDQVIHQTGLAFLWDEQLRFHRWVIEGASVDPWQYRVLAPYLMEGAMRLALRLGYEGPQVMVFVATRLAQNLLVFLTAGVYWRRLGLTRAQTLLGLAVFAWGITYSGYGSSLAFDTYFDVLFYLIAGFLIVSGRSTWTIPLTALAALNRETAALIPVLLVAAAFRPHHSPPIERRTLLTAGLCAALFVAEFVGVRLLLGPRPTMVAYGHHVGLDMFLFNLTNRWTYFSMVATLSYIPVLALLWFPEWPPVLRRFFWTMVPVWVMVHLFMATLAEARLFLVPQALIFIPAAFLVSSRDAAERRTSGRDRISVPEPEDPRV